MAAVIKRSGERHTWSGAGMSQLLSKNTYMDAQDFATELRSEVVEALDFDFSGISELQPDDLPTPQSPSDPPPEEEKELQCTVHCTVTSVYHLLPVFSFTALLVKSYLYHYQGQESDQGSPIYLPITDKFYSKRHFLCEKIDQNTRKIRKKTETFTKISILRRVLRLFRYYNTYSSHLATN